MKCPKCGALNADNAEFCGLCHEAFTSPSSRSLDVPEESIISKEINEQTNYSEWLYPAILSAVIAFLFTLILPKEKIGISMSLAKIMLASFISGCVVSSAGAIKADFKSASIGWFLGLSSSFLAFNLLFFISFLFFKIRPNWLNSFTDLGIIFVSASISLAIAFYLTLDQLTKLKTVGLAMGLFLCNLVLSWVILRLGLNPFPIAVFLSWPASYYTLRFLSSKN